MITTTKALTEIFNTITTPKYRVWKHRFKKSRLGLEVQEQILRDNGYTKKRDAVWEKK